MRRLSLLGRNLANARKKLFANDSQKTFAVRVGVSKATYVKMEQGELSVGLDKYYAAAEILGLESHFLRLFEIEENILDD